jgi:hypothetical protein
MIANKTLRKAVGLEEKTALIVVSHIVHKIFLSKAYCDIANYLA